MKVTLPTGERSEKGRTLLRHGETVRGERGVDQAGQSYDDSDNIHPLNRGCLGQIVVIALIIIGMARWLRA